MNQLGLEAPAGLLKSRDKYDLSLDYDPRLAETRNRDFLTLR